MKFVCFRESDKEKLGILLADDKGIADLSSIELSKKFKNMNDLIINISNLDIEKIKNSLFHGGINSYKTYEVNDVKICSPIKRPIHDIICVGVNYQDHLDETKENLIDKDFKGPKKTVYFSKRASETIGPDDVIISHANIDDQLDYEVELAVIIGTKGRNIPKDKVEDYIFGYTIMNDISARTLQQQHLQWYRGKSLDTFTSLGPVIVHKSQMSFPIQLNVSSRVNGELRQSSNTKHFLADIPSIIAEISSGITLEPGDIIATGTPAGVGLGFKPPRFMKSGDVVECEIEGIGILRNIVK